MVKDKLYMRVELTIIDNLGVKMYSSLPSVIAELVSNSWDADATEVKISIPVGQIDEKSIIEIKDNGYGMDFEEVNDAFLRVGRHRRKELGTDKTKKGRDVIGRKGIGNLAAFGVSNEVIVDTIKGNSKTIFTLNLDDIRATPKGEEHYPPFVKKNTTTKKIGTTIKLTRLKRTKAINIKYVRNALIRIFSIIDNKFKVFINNKIITPDERKSLIASEYTWDINKEIEDGSGWFVKGIIGTSKKPLDENLLGIIVMARGKMIQKATFFDVKGGKEHVRAYMWGELNAEFFDAEVDLMGTARNAILEESDEGQTFLHWIRKEIVDISYEWADKRRENREKIVRQDPEFSEWITDLKGKEKNTFNKAMRLIASDSTLTEEKMKSMARIVKDAIIYDAFIDIVDELDSTPNIEITKILELFEEWDFLRAKEMLKLFEGHLATIEKLDQYIKSDAKEIPIIHKFFKEFPWVLDARWTDYQDEVQYAELLRQHFPEDDKIPEENRRIDFLALGFSDTLYVIELKRPGHAINKDDLQQLEDYVVFARSNFLGTDPDVSYRSISGFIVCGKTQKSAELQERIRNLENNRMYIRRYNELLSMAKRLHKKYIDLYEKYEKKKFST
ncbi:MAG: hypothetical protein GPJ52_01740 [Candidatus Heimdallarchaeota archaeon]|nr:hypothetical protein [Candidatus Heimdallarchaeota archaeon]